METEFWMQVALRTLPAFVVFGLAFIVAADKKSRERWAEWMYQVGNVRNDQRDDPKVQRGVRLPFFIAAALLLIIPIRFYWFLSPTRNVQIVAPVMVSPDNSTAPVSASPTDGSTPVAPGTTTPDATTAPALGGPIAVK